MDNIAITNTNWDIFFILPFTFCILYGRTGIYTLALDYVQTNTYDNLPIQNPFFILFSNSTNFFLYFFKFDSNNLILNLKYSIWFGITAQDSSGFGFTFFFNKISFEFLCFFSPNNFEAVLFP